MDKQMDKWTRDDSKDRADALSIYLSDCIIKIMQSVYCSAQYILALASQSFREGYR